MLTLLLHNWVCQSVGFQFVLDNLKAQFSEWCYRNPDFKAEKEAEPHEYTVTPVDREPAAAGITATPGSTDTPTDLEPAATAPAPAAAPKKKATPMPAARPAGQPSGRESSRLRNQSMKEAAAKQEASRTKPTQQNTRRSTAQETADSAGLADLTTTYAYWTGELTTMMERRTEVVGLLKNCVTRLKTYVFLDPVRLHTEIMSYKSVQQQIRKMESDTTALVKRAANNESVLKILTEFMKEVEEQIAQIDENCAEFEKLSDLSRQHIKEREMKPELDSQPTPK